MPEDIAHSPISADDLAISLAVRRDLGREHDPAVVAEFLGRVGPAIDQRVDARLAAARSQGGGRKDGASTALAFGSLGMGIPITAIALGAGGGGAQSLIALAIAWTGIATVNLAHNRARD